MTARVRDRVHLTVPLPEEESDEEEYYDDRDRANRGRNRERTDKVKLALLWPKKTGAWFTLAESTFNMNSIVTSRLKFYLILPALSDDALDQIDGVLQAADQLRDPYTALKTRLLEIYTPAKLDLMNKLIYGPELGGQGPSQLIDSMMALLP